MASKETFTFKANGLLLKDFPVSRAAFEEYVIEKVIGSSTKQAAVIIPGKDHDVFSLLSTPEKLREAIEKGQEVMINGIHKPLVG